MIMEKEEITYQFSNGESSFPQFNPTETFTIHYNRPPMHYPDEKEIANSIGGLMSYLVHLKEQNNELIKRNKFLTDEFAKDNIIAEKDAEIAHLQQYNHESYHIPEEARIATEKHREEEHLNRKGFHIIYHIAPSAVTTCLEVQCGICGKTIYSNYD